MIAPERSSRIKGAIWESFRDLDWFPSLKSHQLDRAAVNFGKQTNQPRKKMKLTQIAATLIAAATLLTAALPAQADEIYNLNPVARVRTNDIYQNLVKYPNIGCYIAVQTYYSVNAVAERQGLAQKTVDAANAFVSAKCNDSAEAQSQLDKIAADPTFQSESMQIHIAKRFLDLNAAMIELGESW